MMLTAQPYDANCSALLCELHSLIMRTAQPYYATCTALLCELHSLIMRTAQPYDTNSTVCECRYYLQTSIIATVCLRFYRQSNVTLLRVSAVFEFALPLIYFL